MNGSSFDRRSGHLNAGGSSERKAARIVSRDKPVRRTSSLIATPPHEMLPPQLGPLLHVQHTSSWPSLNTNETRLTITPDASATIQGGQIS
ncbi:MAG: hypothetical protein ACXVHJ_37255, partial [Solirubrobacteraceae bacterium]